MAKPVLLTVDDDEQVLRSIERDLRKQYSKDYRIVRAGSGQEGLEALRQLKVRNEAVALLLADQRMPDLDGVGFLEQAQELYPDARRALLTAYADSQAAIDAINRAHIDHYLLKPWDPPDQHLYPVLDDLLADWRSGWRPAFEGIRVIGHRWSPETHAVKDFLGRHQIPFAWVDVESPNAEAQRLVEALGPDAKLPVVLLPDHTRIEQATPEQVAGKLRMATQAKAELYDLVVVGAGPAGLAAAVYGSSEGLRTLLLDREAPGGQAGMSSRIENYLGFPAGLTGGDLARRAVQQATRLGAEIVAPQEAVKLEARDPYRILTLRDGSQVTAYSVVLSTGLAWRKLEVPGVARLTGAGIYYGAAMTEALACANEQVFVVGGANSAGQGAMYFARYAAKVTMLVRGEGLAATMSQYLIDQIAATPNIQVEPHSEVVEALGESNLSGLRIANRKTGEVREEPASALFIFIGAVPCTTWLDGTLEMDERGFLLAGPDLLQDGKRPKTWPLDRDPMLLETSMPGVFVAGDTRAGSVKRVASSVGEGSIAISSVHQHLQAVR